MFMAMVTYLFPGWVNAGENGGSKLVVKPLFTGSMLMVIYNPALPASPCFLAFYRPEIALGRQGQSSNLQVRYPADNSYLNSCLDRTVNIRATIPRSRPHKVIIKLRGQLMYTTKEACRTLGITERHLRLLLQRGEIPGRKLGRDWIVESITYKRKRKPKVSSKDKKVKKFWYPWCESNARHAV